MKEKEKKKVFLYIGIFYATVSENVALHDDELIFRYQLLECMAF